MLTIAVLLAAGLAGGLLIYTDQVERPSTTTSSPKAVTSQRGKGRELFAACRMYVRKGYALPAKL